MQTRSIPISQLMPPLMLRVIIWLWQLVWGVFGESFDRCFVAFGFWESSFANYYLAAFLAPVIFLFASTEWFRRRFIPIAMFWTVIVLAIWNCTTGRLSWFYWHLYHEFASLLQIGHHVCL